MLSPHPDRFASSPTFSPRSASEGAFEQTARTRLSPGSVPFVDYDDVAREEPLELRFGTTPLAVLMRTPGSDEELATGFCLTEGIVKDASEIARVAHCSQGEHADNVILITPSAHCDVDVRRFTRQFFTSSSCGICGKASIERALETAVPVTARTTVDARWVYRLPALLRENQPGFGRTGALHAAGLSTTDGELCAVFEDVGRHNAVDKVIGSAARSGKLAHAPLLVISGRCSFEIVQKALAARLQVIVAVGGVTSLAVDLAKAGGITLVGFASAERASVYSHAERLA